MLLITKEPSPSAFENPKELHKRIERRAYQLYEERGRIHGFDLDDWLQAENEVLDERDMARAA